MKKLYFILTFSFFLFSVNAQNISFSGIDNYWEAIQKMYTTDEINANFTLPDFFPIGWSEDGKFSYFEEADLDARGGTIITFYIFDSVNDKILFQKEYDSFEIDADLHEYILHDDWDEIQNKLAKYRINIDQDVNLARFPYSCKKYEYNIDTDITYTGHDCFPDIEAIDRLTITIKRSDNKEKTVFDRDMENVYGGMIILGILESPYEDRIIILYTLDFFNMCWGPTLYAKMIGCHLEYGFK